MNVREALSAREEAHRVLVRSFKGVDSRDSFCDMTDVWWNMDDALIGGVVYGESRDAVLYGRACQDGSNETLIGQVESEWYESSIIRVCEPCSPEAVGLTAVTVDCEDGHGYAIYVFDDAKRIL